MDAVVPVCKIAGVLQDAGPAYQCVHGIVKSTTEAKIFVKFTDPKSHSYNVFQSRALIL